MRKRATIVDVAQRAGVAVSTASDALNGRPGVAEATRDRVRQAASDLAWVPSVRGRSLGGKRIYSIGLVVQRPPVVLESDPFFFGFIAGIESALETAGYALVLQVATAETGPERLRTLVLSGAVDGVLVTDVAAGDPRFDLLRDLGAAAVAVNADGGLGIASVSQDHSAGLQELVQHLVGLGHRDIAHITGSPGLVHSVEREGVWQTVLEAAGLVADLRVEGDFTADSGRRAFDQLWDGARRPTAIVCANDLCAIGVLSRAHERGVSVPGEVSVTGFDGIDLGAYVSPALTTVATSPYELGRASALVLLEMLDGSGATAVAISPARVVLRASVGVPRHW